MRALVRSCCIMACVAMGCGVPELEEAAAPEVATAEQELGGGDLLLKLKAKRLFEKETFGGNGRTCATCHNDKDGALSPAEAQARFQKNPHDPLFRRIDSDDGVGTSYTKLLNDATIRVTIPLPSNWSLAGSTARSVTMRRGVSSTLNVPSLDTIFMADGRNVGLESQALGAVNAHYQPGRQPTANELGLIASHQQTFSFFSSPKLRQYANGGPEPVLPPGHTQSEKRGRLWFVRSAAGICSHCHAGPMLNETSEFLIPPPGVIVPPGSRFFSAFVSEFNKANAPVLTFNVTTPTGTVVVQSPDPGRALITGELGDVNAFRIPTLWGSAKTGPWFHDNSARTLQDMAQHYSDYFTIVLGTPLTAQQQADIVAYLKLLD
ncbi:MAG: hypothetical protein JNK82_04005 [Myxococcaceae bacterium]|nr:hypothetical protein [Myxococcaceae bacterium]